MSDHLKAWAMEPTHLQGFASDLRERPSRAPEARGLGRTASDPSGLPFKLEDRTAVIEVRGSLMRRPDWWARYLGATGYSEISSQVKAAVESDRVDSILLVIESPGGESDGLVELGDELRTAGAAKPLRAHIEALGASAAYWLAAQAETITASPNARVGSIGTYIAIWDTSGRAEQAGVKVHVVRSGEHKGAGAFGDVVTEVQLSAFQEMVDGITASFVDTVSEGRGLDRSAVEALATGRTWLSDQAITLGLIDGVATRAEALNSLSNTRRRPQMADTPTPTGATPAEVEAAKAKAADEARSAALTEERKRASDLRAAFPDDADFASEQIASGASVLEAKAAYADVLQEKVKAQGEELAKAKSEKPKEAPKSEKPKGAKPMPMQGGASSSDSGEGDFMTRARELKKEEGIGIREAMSRISKQDPDCYEAYLGNAKKNGKTLKREAKARALARQSRV